MNPRAPGFSMIELLLVAVLGAVVMGAVYRTLVVQEQSSRQQRSILSNHQANRMRLGVLASELREISAADGDLAAAAHDSVSFRAYRELAIVCGVDVPGSRLDVYMIADSLRAEDEILVYVDGDPLTAEDDRWASAAISNNTTAGSCAPWAAYDRYEVLRLPVPNGSGRNQIPIDLVGIGALVRGFEWVTYGMYQADGEWILGRHAPDGDVVAVVSPLAQPSAGGLEFRYFNAAGTGLTPPLAPAGRKAVARVEVKVRGEAGSAPRSGSAALTDSLVTQVFLRGN